MSYIYCVKVSPQTKDDVNLRFRESDLKGELFGTSDGGLFVCPQLSYKMWATYPQSKDLSVQADKDWDKVIADCIKLLMQKYGMVSPAGHTGWQKIESSFRCSKMESFIRESDVNS